MLATLVHSHVAKSRCFMTVYYSRPAYGIEKSCRAVYPIGGLPLRWPLKQKGTIRFDSSAGPHDIITGVSSACFITSFMMDAVPRRLYSTCSTAILGMDSIGLRFCIAPRYLFGRHRAFCPGPLPRQRGDFHLIEIINLVSLWRPSIPLIL